MGFYTSQLLSSATIPNQSTMNCYAACVLRALMLVLIAMIQGIFDPFEFGPDSSALFRRCVSSFKIFERYEVFSLVPNPYAGSVEIHWVSTKIIVKSSDPAVRESLVDYSFLCLCSLSRSWTF